MGSEVASFFGWLDYDQREADRMLEVFAAFDDKDTIDSLGIGVIRDTLSDQLFPGVSTVQTRARYFLFVPWICQLLEAERVPPAKFDQRLRELEVALIESLRPQEGPDKGVIGYRARKRLARLPSSVYWNGLQVFGLRQMKLSTAEYRAIAGRLATIDAAVGVDDDDGPVIARRRMWDPTIAPLMPAGFPFAPISLTLSGEESELLSEKIAISCPDTMIGQLARDLSIDRTAEEPWQVQISNPGPRLSEALRHARNFSELIEGAQALYNLLLARRAEQHLELDCTDLIATLLEQLDDWSNLVTGRSAELQRWLDSGEFWQFIETRAHVAQPTRRFVMKWARSAFADPAGAAHSADAAALVTERELKLKGKLARLVSDRALENWNGQPFSPGRMTYRWKNARQILDDLQFHEGA